VKTFWGDNENDIAVDRATPHLVKMLAHCQAILDECGNTTDGELSDALNIIDIMDKLMDVVAAVRAYSKNREEEFKEQRQEGGTK
jgi:transcription elongation factor Elf1